VQFSGLACKLNGAHNYLSGNLPASALSLISQLLKTAVKEKSYGPDLLGLS